MKPQNSTLYRIKYEFWRPPGFRRGFHHPTRNHNGRRPLAIHPEDPRWENLKGKHATRPINPQAIPIIADEAVEKDFGTGILKITPAHDRLDFEIAQQQSAHDRHTQPGWHSQRAGRRRPRGHGSIFGPQERGQKTFEDGHLLNEEEHQNNVGYSERAGVPIEPRLSEQ